QLSSISSSSGLNASAPSTPKPPALLTAATTSRQWLKAKIGSSTSSFSQMGVRIVLSLSAGGTPARRVLHRLLELVHQPRQLGTVACRPVGEHELDVVTPHAVHALDEGGSVGGGREARHAAVGLGGRAGGEPRARGGAGP